jgi:hypothetical protein
MISDRKFVNFVFVNASIVSDCDRNIPKRHVLADSSTNYGVEKAIAVE